MQMERQTQGLLLENTPAAYYRAGRLRVKHPNLCQGYFIDICVAIILPSLLGAAIAATSVAVLKNVDGAELWIVENLYSGQVLSSLGTMIVFLVTLRLGDNLARNGKIVGHFGNLTGTCVNMAIWTRSLVSGGNLDYVNYPSGNGGTYKTTEIGLILASIPYVVKYHYREVKVHFEMLPIAASPAILARATELITSKDNYVAVGPFLAMVMVLAERFDDLESEGKIKPPELVTIFAQLNALTGEEGSIGGTQGYALPGILTFLLYLIFALYYFLLILSDLGPTNEWQSLWIVGILITTNFGLFSVSNRYANPFTVSVKNSTQVPLISDAARGCEVAIDGVFGKRGRIAALGAPGGGKGSVQLKGGATTQLSLGLGMGLQ